MRGAALHPTGASQFRDEGISPLTLFLGALGPTIIVGAIFACLPQAEAG